MNGPLYRYSSKAFNEQLMNEGVVRIGTLYDFRNSEHAKGIADPSEGKKKVFHTIYDWKINEEVPGLPSKTMRATSEIGMFSFAPGGGQFISGITLEREILSRDYYIHCTSHRLSHDVMKEFEGAETCIEIIDPRGFYELATRSLNEITPVKLAGAFIIKYMDRDEEWNGVDNGIDGCIIKEVEFKGQYEVRAIWSPLNSTNIKPEFIRNMDLTKHCRRIL